MFKRKLGLESTVPKEGTVSAAPASEDWELANTEDCAGNSTTLASWTETPGRCDDVLSETISSSLLASTHHRFSVQSSLYSQPSPEMKEPSLRLEIPRASSIYPDDVSPPDSPRTIDGVRSQRSMSPNISPITDGGNSLRSVPGGKSFVSSIPLPKSSTSGTAAYISGWREKIAKEKAAVADEASTPDGKALRWDSYSGEPSAKGKPQTTIPAQYAEQFEKKDRSAPSAAKARLGNESSVTSVRQQRQNLWATKLRKVGKKDQSTLPKVQEEWKGSSGRAAIVPPPTTKQLAPGEKAVIPQPQRDRAGSKTGLRTQSVGTASRAKSPSPARNATSSERALSHRASFNALPRKDSLNVQPAGLQAARGSPSIASSSPPAAKSSPPAAIIVTGRRTPSPDRRSPLTRQPPKPITITKRPVGSRPAPLSASPTAITTSPAGDQLPTAQRSPRATTMSKGSPPGSADSANSANSDNSKDEQRIRSAVSALKLDLVNEPSSRFSMTTYNSAIPDSPPETPHLSEEDRPSLPNSASSILHRKRPVPTAGVAVGKGPSRKPTPAELETSYSRKQSLSGKPMPPSPAGLNEPPIDRVMQLQAKLTALNRRQGNLQTVIHELTHVVQPSSLAYDMASRSEIKKTVDGLKTESAAVAKEVHETGMKLHRALKRRDEESMFEPTGLWVRRVTE